MEMGSLKKAGDILPLFFKLKDCIVSESEKSGKIEISQDILNTTLKKETLNKLHQINDFNCDFYEGEITITKKVLLIPLTIKLHSFKFILNNDEYKIIAKHVCGCQAFVANLFDLLPDFLIASKEDIEIDLTKIDGFDKIKTEGVFGIDILNTTQISFESCKQGCLTFSYEFI